MENNQHSNQPSAALNRGDIKVVVLVHIVVLVVVYLILFA